jgi:tRNA (cmo5U34)-methyltransferase
MNDNTTSSKASEYDANICSVIPNYLHFHREALELVQVVKPSPHTWLDTGCGTGTFVSGAVGLFPRTKFILADPSEAMLSIASDKLAAVPGNRIVFERKGTQELEEMSNSLDVITAIQAHHYLDGDRRKAATENCFRMLKPGGLYITFENIRPFTVEGVGIGRERWRRFQSAAGRSRELVENNISRFDREYFPITVEQHLALLREAGFRVAELLNYDMMQAGFYTIK